MSETLTERERKRFAAVKPEIEDRLADIAELMTPDVRLTLVMRHPTEAECYFVMSDDADYNAVSDLLRRHAKASE